MAEIIKLNEWKIYKETLLSKKMINQSSECNKKDRKPGVWCLLGTKKGKNGKNGWRCLQVGQTVDMCKEIKKDIHFLDDRNEPAENDFTCKEYINQCGKKVFDIYKGIPVRKQIYQKICKQYENLMFVILCVEPEKCKRREIEKYFAFKTEAMFWRNGRPFQTEVKRNIDEILKNINEKLIDSELLKAIDALIKDISRDET